jgi:hypothetical protein
MTVADGGGLATVAQALPAGVALLVAAGEGDDGQQAEALTFEVGFGKTAIPSIHFCSPKWQSH